MKSLLLHFSKEEYQKLRQAKSVIGAKNWKDFFIMLIDSKLDSYIINDAFNKLKQIDHELAELLRILFVRVRNASIDRDEVIQLLKQIIAGKSK